MTKKHPSISGLGGLRWLLTLALVVLNSAGLSAQTVPVTPSAPADVVELSPFQVSAEKDVGYQGGNTTSGSRLNTSLKDTPAAITAFTPEFLSDLGATSLDDIIGYAPNMEKEVNQYSPAPDTSFFGGADRRETTVRIRGLAASTAADFFETGIKIDLYNVERIEQSSGPNSILFGLGSPGGLINTSTKRAKVSRSQTSLRLQLGSDEFQRFEIDHNQMLIPHQLALRLNGLRQKSDSWRKFNFDNSDRLAGSVQWKPWEKTALTVNYETGKMRSGVDRMYNAFDSVALYDARGGVQKSDAQYNATVDRPLGINRNTTVRSIYGTDATGATAPFAFFATNATGRRVLESTYDDLNTPITVPRAGATLLSPSQLPYTINIFGPQSWRDSHFNRFNSTLEQRLTKDIALEVAYNHESFAQDVQAPSSGTTTLYRDANTFIPNPNGSTTPVANPNVGRYYIETQWGGDTGGFKNDVVRASLSWELNLGKWGRHNLAGMAEYGVKEEYRTAGTEVMLDQNNVAISNAAAPGNNNNKLYRRQYVTLGDFDSYVTTGPDDPVTFANNGVPYHSRMVYFRGVSDVERITKSAMVVTQSRFFKDRLVFTGGIRQDDLVFNTLNNTNTYNASDPLVQKGIAIANTTYFTRDIIAQNKTKPQTTTLGAVYRLNSVISLFYNHGNNVGQPAFNIRVLPDLGPAPATKGVTDDTGFMLDFLDGRLFVRATAYQTALVDGSPQIYNNVITNVNRAILDGLLNAGRITQDQYNQREFGASGTVNVAGLSNSVTKGVDLTVSYNPTKSVTLQTNFSYSKTSRSNVAPEIDGWLQDAKTFWYSTPAAGALLSGNTTLGATIDDNVAGMVSNIAAYRDGILLNYGNRPYKINGSGRYSFLTGALKGAFVGGGVRWQSKSLIGRDIVAVNATGAPIFGTEFYGPQSFNVDGFLGYRRKIGLKEHKVDLTFQLNVTNLTDEPAVQLLRRNALRSGYSKMVVGAPRQYRLSASLGF